MTDVAKEQRRFHYLDANDSYLQMRISLICGCELFLTVDANKSYLDLTVYTLVIVGVHGQIRRMRQVSLEPVTTDCHDRLGFSMVLHCSVCTGSQVVNTGGLYRSG
jgi:hypothetical protein